jgi:hypothetical protein
MVLTCAVAALAWVWVLVVVLVSRPELELVCTLS